MVNAANTEDVRAPASLETPLSVPNKMLMAAGPSNLTPRAAQAGGLPSLGPMHPETFRLMDEIKEGLQYAFQTKNPVTLCLSCAGHGGMEAALANILEPGDTAVMCKNSFWFDRASDMATRQGARVVPIDVKPGQPLTLEAAEEAVAKHRPRLLFVVHGESSTGVHQSLEGFGAMCHKYGTLLVVDAVASLGGTPLYTDRWELDVVYSGSQKVFNAPPGLSPITFSPRAMEHIQSRKTPCPVFYYDVLSIGDSWGCFGKRSYHHTLPVTLFYALREALALVAEEGLTASWRRHQLAAQRLHDGLERLGLRLLVEKPEHRLATVTAVLLPDNMDWATLLRTAMARHAVDLSAGLGPTFGRAFRVGLMGTNANPKAVDRVVNVLQDVIKNPIAAA
ncbi:serine--pyruvate aminotransferase, mitochondrial-like [Thrips palmi]|uniref:Alanine--glyoxylate aminotransferase n=1 Tax=Thrips palmi TaxID=161013 RepID=A0A6P8ZSS7_THRPL|nr:serine--pyruvate aminotransferase, mitochondrial-like [Thrips palmi]